MKGFYQGPQIIIELSCLDQSPRTHASGRFGTTTKAGSHANRNAGFIRQAGEWHWGCRINPAFQWWCQDAPHASPSAPGPASINFSACQFFEVKDPRSKCSRDGHRA
jgi:hypothetical protein